jgi:RNA polymerase sigma-70 factor (ECF subfamily)
MSPVEELHWFNTEVKPCEPALRAYLQKRFAGLDDHDDLVQEAYVRLLNIRRKGRLVSAKAFLFTIARNLAIDMFRRRQRAASHEPISELADVPALDVVGDGAFPGESQQRLEVLLEAVLSLPERCREVMVLRHLDGLSYKEIADRLEISPNTVRVHLVKGVSSCTAFFRKKGLFEHDLANPEAGLKNTKQ